MSLSVMDFAQRYSQGWAAHDPDAIVAMHTEDTVFHMRGGEPAVGRDAAREAFAGLFAMAPDLAFELVRAHFGDDHYVTEYVVSGTIDGKSFAVDGVDVFALRDGLVARKDTYLDSLTYATQLGLDLAATAEHAAG